MHLEPAGGQVAVLWLPRCRLCDGEHSGDHPSAVQLALALGQLAAAELQKGVEVLHGVRVRPGSAWLQVQRMCARVCTWACWSSLEKPAVNLLHTKSAMTLSLACVRAACCNTAVLPDQQ